MTRIDLDTRVTGMYVITKVINGFVSIVKS